MMATTFLPGSGAAPAPLPPTSSRALARLCLRDRTARRSREIAARAAPPRARVSAMAARPEDRIEISEKSGRIAVSLSAARARTLMDIPMLRLITAAHNLCSGCTDARDISG